jgi:hypothetical protein
VTATAGFLTFLLVTVALLVLVLLTGFRARRRQHIPLVVLTVASLGVTIYFAEQLGREYDLDTAGAIKPIHLTLAKIATVSYLLPVATGIRTIFVPKTRRLHRNVAFLVLALTVAALVTGSLMIFMATPLEVATPS